MKNIYAFSIFIAALTGAATADAQNLTEAQIDSIERAAYGVDTKNLQEIVVTADAPVIKVEGDKITYEVAQDPTSSGQTVLDMLRKVPMVSVDGQDNITLKGEGNYKIYVNGRPDPTLSSNASTILKAMPANSVSKVEVITDPGAKYDAEGTGGIINLITERKRRESGYNGSINASVTNRDVYAGIFGAAKWNKVTLNANLNYMNQQWNTAKGYYDSFTLYHTDPVNHRLSTSNNTARKFSYLGADISGSWEASEFDLVNFSLDYADVDGSMDMTDGFTKMEDLTGNTLWSYRRDSYIKMKFATLVANAAWQHNFNRSDNYLAFSYQFDFGKTSSPLSETFGDFINYSLPYLSHTTTNDAINRSHTLQIDYSNQLSEHALLETGAKAIFRRNSAIASGQGSNDLVEYSDIPSEYSDISQPQDIYAIYALYKAIYGKWSANAGIRYEHTRMGIHYRYGDLSDFTNRLNDVVPNAGVTYSFSPASALSITYGMRISRPSLEQVNPYRLNYSETEAMQGNPYLRSERINKVSISYRNFGRLLGGSVSLDYNHTGNAITDYSYLEGNIVVRTNANIGRKDNIAISAFLMSNVSRNVRLSFNGLAGYTYYRANGSIDISNHGWSGNISHNGEWKMPADINLNWYGGYNFGQIGLQTKGGDFYYYGLGLARDFLADKSLRITVSATNFAQKQIKFTSTISTPTFYTHTINRMDNWRVGIALTWKFGKTNSMVKSVNSRITNDDLSKGGVSSPASAQTPGN